MAVDATGSVWFFGNSNDGSTVNNEEGNIPAIIFKYDPDTSLETLEPTFTHPLYGYSDNDMAGLDFGPSGDLWGIGRFFNCTYPCSTSTFKYEAYTDIRCSLPT